MKQQGKEMLKNILESFLVKYCSFLQFKTQSISFFFFLHVPITAYNKGIPLLELCLAVYLCCLWLIFPTFRLVRVELNYCNSDSRPSWRCFWPELLFIKSRSSQKHTENKATKKPSWTVGVLKGQECFAANKIRLRKSL